MSFKQFCERIRMEGWTEEQLRCDVPPSQEILAFIDVVGDRYESFLDRWIRADVARRTLTAKQVRQMFAAADTARALDPTRDSLHPEGL